MVHEITSVQDFEETLQNYPDLVMEFYASWCPHCKAFAPNLAEASHILENKGIYFARTEIDTFENLANQYNVESIPTLTFFKNGSLVAESAGERDVQGVISFVDQALQNA